MFYLAKTDKILYLQNNLIWIWIHKELRLKNKHCVVSDESEYRQLFFRLILFVHYLRKI